MKWLGTQHSALTMRVRATTAYDGTAFYGFQRQAGFRSVQGEIEAALAAIGGEKLVVRGAGRTDTGVHATGQVVAFDIEWRHGLDALERAININLPADVAVCELRECAPGFSPRFDALSRTYEYTLYSSPVRQPMRDRYAWQVAGGVELAAMRSAAELLVGEHDFAAFGSATTDSDVTVRNVMRAEWRERGSDMVFEIEANAFLYRMVRRLVNALVKVGRGRLTQADVADALASRDQDRITGLAPACGLCLVNVKYQV